MEKLSWKVVIWPTETISRERGSFGLKPKRGDLETGREAKTCSKAWGPVWADLLFLNSRVVRSVGMVVL